ncbi:glycosyltransferase family 2 protein [Candidatus Dojkabacteria bacterium]|uniref:Glycosyltransferase family 2 protein n=1 Tax=Candidatus Dojkabacteria bacterium TaxID=2099670 RepID=A0A5C7J6H5_9BACT|nr:MAG: glycosyltransferase family 2 protein [Candidatus Dojkabacteria bacterium]
MERKGIGVVILNYRGETILLPCVESVLAELGPDDGCLIIDHGQEKELMRRVKERFPSVSIIEPEKNEGFARGMNRGLAQIFSQPYAAAWLLNNDTVVLPGALKELKAAQQRFPGTHLFSPVILNQAQAVWFAGGEIHWWRMRTKHRRVLQSESQPFETRFLTGCALLVPYTTYRTLGGFDERYFLYYEDAEYSVRTTQQGGRLLVIPRSRVIHEEVSNLNPDKLYWLVRSGVEFFSRHTPSWQRWWFRSFLTIRRLYNWMRCFFSADPLARAVKRAYTDASI